MTDDELKNALINQLTVPIWPHAAMALGLSRNPTYEAAKRGEIPTIRIGGSIRVPTAHLRKLLGIEPIKDAPSPVSPEAA